MKKISYKHTIYTCYIGYVVQAIINNLGPLLFLTFQESLGVSIEKIGFLITINFGVQIIVDMIAAKYVDRIGYRKCIVFAHIATTIGLIGMGIFPFILPNPYIGLVIAISINAIGGGLIEVLVSPIVEAAPSKEKDKAMSILHSFYCFGHVAVVILSTVGFLIIGIEKWYYLPIIWAIVPFINIFMFSIVPINTVVEDGEAIPIKKLFSLKVFWVFSLLMICSGASEQAMSQWASLFAESGLKVSKTLGDLLGPCTFAALMGLSRLFYGKCGSRIDLQKFILGSSVLCICSYLVAIFSSNPIVALLGCAFTGLSVGIMWPGSFSIAAKECPQGGTAMFAFLALAGDIGAAAGPGVVSSVAKISGGLDIRAGLFCAMVFPIMMFVVVFIKIKTRRKEVSKSITDLCQ